MTFKKQLKEAYVTRELFNPHNTIMENYLLRKAGKGCKVLELSVIIKETCLPWKKLLEVVERYDLMVVPYNGSFGVRLVE